MLLLLLSLWISLLSIKVNLYLLKAVDLLLMLPLLLLLLFVVVVVVVNFFVMTLLVVFRCGQVNLRLLDSSVECMWWMGWV